jgi:hypothetical protein
VIFNFFPSLRYLFGLALFRSPSLNSTLGCCWFFVSSFRFLFSSISFSSLSLSLSLSLSRPLSLSLYCTYCPYPLRKYNLYDERVYISLFFIVIVYLLWCYSHLNGRLHFIKIAAFVIFIYRFPSDVRCL